jgi:hypothetical protein
MDNFKPPHTCPIPSRKLNIQIDKVTPIVNNTVNTDVIISNYTITDKRLGRGSSASVYLGYHTIKNMKLL